MDGGSRWGKIDGHNGCEWVNVSSGTCHPGCHRQNPDSRKTVVKKNVVSSFSMFLVS